MTSPTLTLQPLWINHIERFPERMRPRLYGALSAFLLHRTPIPEKLLPYLGIILDLMGVENEDIHDKTENETLSDSSHCLPTLVPDIPAEELEYLSTFTTECARRYCDKFNIDRETFETTVRNIFDHWQKPHGSGDAIRHKDEDDFWQHMSSAVYYEFTVTQRIVPKEG